MSTALPGLRTLIRVPSSDNGTEILWAESLEGGTYRLLSVPVFAYGISRGAVVLATVDVVGVRLERVVEESPGATLRVYTQEPHLATWLYQDKILPVAAALGLGIGPATLFDPEVVAIHVQSRPQWQAVGRVLDTVVANGMARFWELGDPNLQTRSEEPGSSNTDPWQLVHPPPDDREVFLLTRGS